MRPAYPPDGRGNRSAAAAAEAETDGRAAITDVEDERHARRLAGDEPAGVGVSRRRIGAAARDAQRRERPARAGVTPLERDAVAPTGGHGDRHRPAVRADDEPCLAPVRERPLARVLD